MKTLKEYVNESFIDDALNDKKAKEKFIKIWPGLNHL